MQAKQYRRKAILIEATQWFKNGDHPQDNVMRPYEDTGELPTEPREGAVVRYFRHPSSKGIEICPNCGKSNHDHGWIDVRGGGITVCPGDFVVTWPIEGGYMYRVLKPDQFALEFEDADRPSLLRFTDEQRAEFETLARPVMAWLEDNAHPHVTVIMDMSHCQLTEGMFAFPRQVRD